MAFETSRIRMFRWSSMDIFVCVCACVFPPIWFRDLYYLSGNAVTRSRPTEGTRFLFCFFVFIGKAISRKMATFGNVVHKLWRAIIEIETQTHERKWKTNPIFFSPLLCFCLFFSSVKTGYVDRFWLQHLGVERAITTPLKPVGISMIKNDRGSQMISK